MQDPDIEKLLQDGQGYNLNIAHVVEFLMARTIANSFLSSEVLRRQIELEQLIRNGAVDHEKAAEEYNELCQKISGLATAEKNHTISELFFLNKGG